ncbi:MAG: carbohydrate-binding protein [Eubacterium sp.]|nr:carbohydrate-binding protein [Eubacterium sp.]
MAELCLKVLDGNYKTLAVSRGEGEACIVFSQEYKEGDMILFEASQQGTHIWLQLDDALGKSLVYVTGMAAYQIPFGNKRINLSPKAFSGTKHLICAREAKDYEVAAYRNLAVNVCDQSEARNIFPHAQANVETRGEAVFAAQNAIDGVTVTSCHGEWPYGSWGINKQDDAEIKIDFGREVEADRIIMYTRADFPHDNWWKQVSFSFSDGSSFEWELQKKDNPHEIVFEQKRISWLKLHDMKKSDEPSPFPALTQIEVYGRM